METFKLYDVPNIGTMEFIHVRDEEFFIIGTTTPESQEILERMASVKDPPLTTIDLDGSFAERQDDGSWEILADPYDTSFFD